MRLLPRIGLKRPTDGFRRRHHALNQALGGRGLLRKELLLPGEIRQSDGLSRGKHASGRCPDFADAVYRAGSHRRVSQ